MRKSLQTLISFGVIVAVGVVSLVWLFKMSDVLKSHPANVEIEYRLDDSDCVSYGGRTVYLTAEAKREDMYFKVFKESEEHLRNQLNSWLTILGFFGVVLGLIVPLANYLLQRSSLTEERDRLDRDIEEKIHKAVEEARREAEAGIENVKRLARDAMTKAEAVYVDRNGQSENRPLPKNEDVKTGLDGRDNCAVPTSELSTRAKEGGE